MRPPGRAQPDKPFGVPNRPRRYCGCRVRTSVVDSHRSSWPSVQEPFNLPALLPNTVSFVPVHFSLSNRAARQANRRNAFLFAPVSATITFSQESESSDASSCSNSPDLGDLNGDLKVHLPPFYRLRAIPVSLASVRAHRRILSSFALNRINMNLTRNKGCAASIYLIHSKSQPYHNADHANGNNSLLPAASSAHYKYTSSDSGVPPWHKAPPQYGKDRHPAR